MSEPIKYPECVGCGHCCLSATCLVGAIHYELKEPTRCPALFQNEIGQYRCRLAEQYAEDLYIGAGCPCTLFNTKRENMIKILERLHVKR